MSDFDAIVMGVRQALSGAKPNEAIETGVREALSGVHQRMLEAIGEIVAECTRPSVLYKPTLQEDRRGGPDNACWIASLGEPPNQLVGIGDTPEQAMLAFDRKFYGKKP